MKLCETLDILTLMYLKVGGGVACDAQREGFPSGAMAPQLRASAALPKVLREGFLHVTQCGPELFSPPD